MSPTDPLPSLHDDADTDLAAAIESVVDEHAARVKHILTALTSAAVPFDCWTANALQDVGRKMVAFLHAVDDEEAHT